MSKGLCANDVYKEVLIITIKALLPTQKIIRTWKFLHCVSVYRQPYIFTEIYNPICKFTHSKDCIALG